MIVNTALSSPKSALDLLNAIFGLEQGILGDVTQVQDSKRSILLGEFRVPRMVRFRVTLPEFDVSERELDVCKDFGPSAMHLVK